MYIHLISWHHQFSNGFKLSNFPLLRFLISWDFRLFARRQAKNIELWIAAVAMASAVAATMTMLTIDVRIFRKFTIFPSA